MSDRALARSNMFLIACTRLTFTSCIKMVLKCRLVLNQSRNDLSYQGGGFFMDNGDKVILVSYIHFYLFLENEVLAIFVVSVS